MNTTEIRPAPEAPVAEPGQLDEETRDVLRRAKGLVAKEWAQGDMNVGGHSASGFTSAPYCALTAIWAVTLNVAAANALVATLGVETRREVALWNDAPERTQADVVALYDAALTGQPYKP
jgi:hypothetical protein